MSKKSQKESKDIRVSKLSNIQIMDIVHKKSQDLHNTKRSGASLKEDTKNNQREKLTDYRVSAPEVTSIPPKKSKRRVRHEKIETNLKEAHKSDDTEQNNNTRVIDVTPEIPGNEGVHQDAMKTLDNENNDNTIENVTLDLTKEKRQETITTDDESTDTIKNNVDENTPENDINEDIIKGNNNVSQNNKGDDNVGRITVKLIVDVNQDVKPDIENINKTAEDEVKTNIPNEEVALVVNDKVANVTKMVALMNGKFSEHVASISDRTEYEDNEKTFDIVESLLKKNEQTQNANNDVVEDQEPSSKISKMSFKNSMMYVQNEEVKTGSHNQHKKISSISNNEKQESISDNIVSDSTTNDFTASNNSQNNFYPNLDQATNENDLNKR